MGVWGFMFTKGERVRFKNDPSVIGVVTGAEAFERAGRSFIEIELPSGKTNCPVNQLEPVLAAPDALADLKAGKLSAPTDLRRALTHLRMTGRLADMIYSMGATNTEFHAYQFKPVLKLLNSPSRGLLIADEVGLGKTIEAGLIWTELVARFDSRRLLIICPKALVQKWREELRNKFNVNAPICGGADLLEILKDDQVRREGFTVIASLSSLRPPKKWNDPDEPAKGPRAELASFLADAEDDLFDLTIIDEAHHLRNTETTNHRLGQLVTSVSDYSLFLSATPINLRANDLRALLKLIDPDTFEREWLFDVLQEENAPLIRAWEAARDPSVSLSEIEQIVADLPEGQVLKTSKRLERLRTELAKGLEDTPSNRVRLAARIEEMSLLGSIINRTRRRDVADLKVLRKPNTASWRMSDCERQFYDAATRQIEEYAYEYDLNGPFLLAQTQRLLASSLATAYRHWGGRSGFLDLDEEDEDPRNNKIPGPLISRLGEVCDDPTVLAELERNDSKLKQLIVWLKDVRARDPQERIIIFSSFRKTIDYLTKRLGSEGFAVMELHGGVKADRQETIARFADSPGGTILLTSEVGGEGLDLQFCRTLFNWDLPWNPMKVEQRIGRIDRIGQQSPSIDIINMIAEGTIEERVYERLYVRLDIIKQTIGDFEPILGNIIRDIELILTNPELTPEQKDERLKQASLAAEERKAQEEKLEREAPGLVAHGESILQRINDAQAPHRRLTASDLKDYVAGALVSLFEGTRIQPTEDSEIDAYDIKLSASAQAQFSHYRTTQARRYPTRFSREGSAGVRSVFGSNPDPIKYRAIEPIPMTHPLARFCAGLIEERMSGITPRPATAMRIARNPDWDVSPGTYVICVEKWSIDGIVPIDRLAFAGAPLVGGSHLSEDMAERMLMEGLMAEPGLRPMPQEELLQTSRLVEASLLPFLEERRADFEGAEAARHDDLVDTQLSLIREHMARETARAEDQIRDHKLSGSDRRMNLSYAVKAKLDKFLARMELRLADISKRILTFPAHSLVGIAVVEIGEDLP
jgi:superfamily II DNA or RNA helicase